MTKAELWVTLDGIDATMIRRWGSLWADLLHCEMALLERSQLEPGLYNTFHRRALWESAVISYGRASVSNRKRKVAFTELVQEVTGDAGTALHRQIMDWRHGHVAHRTSSEFEATEVVAAFYSDNPMEVSAIRFLVGSDLGPVDDSPFIVAVRSHVETLRMSIFDRHLSPLTDSIIDTVSKKPDLLHDARTAKDPSTAERMVINFMLRGLPQS